MKLSAPKGTKDILPSESELWQFMEDKARFVFDKSNYKEIRTPIFETTELFARGVGDSTDIVTKEMYTFVQKERSLTLRPENTAGVARAFIEHGMHKLSAPIKLWYNGPMFRYERPQAGRQRQFHQVGVEVFGIKEPSADAEVIQLAMWYLQELGIQNLALEINNIGCPKCRQDYRDKLKNALSSKLPNFCGDCHVRFDKNVLRMLDCKNPECKQHLSTDELAEIIQSDYVCPECSDHFSKVQEYLTALNIPFTLNKKLVRGLDYYIRTVFEITSNMLGSQNAVCGGGRYDPLVELIGGVPTPGIGWAMGMERLMALMPKPELKKLNVFVVSNYMDEALKLVTELRKSGLSVDFDMANRKFGKQLEKASRLEAKYAVILGEDELKSGELSVKNLETGMQEKITRDSIVNHLLG